MAERIASMKNLIWFVLCFIGCSEAATELTAWQKAMRDGSVEAVAATKTVESKTDEAIGILRDNTTALAAIKSQIDSLEASVVSSTPNGKEVIQSVPPESPAKANTQQARLNVATPGTSSETLTELATRLYGRGVSVHMKTEEQLRAIDAQLNGGQPVSGGIFPNNRTSGITSQRTSVRSLPQRVSFFGRAKYSTRQSCPSGRCPQR